MDRSLLLVALCAGLACDSNPAPVADDATQEATAPAETTQEEKPQQAKAEGKKERPSFAEMPPKVGEAAPEFELAALSGETMKLADVRAEHPAVLVFGSYS